MKSSSSHHRAKANTIDTTVKATTTPLLPPTAETAELAVTVAEAAEPVAEAEDEPPLAAAWKAAKVLAEFSLVLMAKTIP